MIWALFIMQRYYSTGDVKKQPFSPNFTSLFRLNFLLLLNSYKFLYTCIYYWHVFQYFRAVKMAVRPLRLFLPQSIYIIINKKEA